MFPASYNDPRCVTFKWQHSNDDCSEYLANEDLNCWSEKRIVSLPLSDQDHSQALLVSAPLLTVA